MVKMAILLLAAGSLVVAACASGDDSSSASVPQTLTTTSTTVTETTTTAPATTTTVAETTTTAPPTTTTTTAPPTTTTTTAPPTTTTTTTVPPTVELNDEGIQAGDVWVHFGFDDEDAIAAVSNVLGAPTKDFGWSEETICFAATRTVRWDDFLMLFTTGDTDFWTGGVPHFFMFFYSGSNPELFTTKGIGLNSTVADLEAAYGGPKFVLTDSPWVAGEGSWSYDLQTWTGLWGYTSGLAPTGTVTAINGGQGCGE